MTPKAKEPRCPRLEPPRAWLHEEKKMGEAFIINYHEKYVYVDLGSDDIRIAEFSDITLLQPTGLRDKNDVMIFEGDVVKGGFLTPGVVEWNEIAAAFIVEPIEKDGYSWSHLSEGFGLLSPNSVEVIGNVHENPEMMGGGGS